MDSNSTHIVQIHPDCAKTFHTNTNPSVSVLTCLSPENYFFFRCEFFLNHCIILNLLEVCSILRLFKREHWLSSCRSLFRYIGGWLAVDLVVLSIFSDVNCTIFFSGGGATLSIILKSNPTLTEVIVFSITDFLFCWSLAVVLMLLLPV